MQAIYKKLEPLENFSFFAKKQKLFHFYDRWHFHPEIELAYVIEGKGTRLIGENIATFEADELVFLGSNLPHLWKSESEYYSGIPNLFANCVVIQFLPNFIYNLLNNLPEANKIILLFENIKRGIKINGKAKCQVKTLMLKISESSEGIKRICLLLELLEIIADNTEFDYLNSLTYADLHLPQESEKIKKVLDFTYAYYSRKILINEVAGIVNMSVANFCKYFKRRTQKTYINFLTEVRIGHSCQMLIENKKTVQFIASDCGFNNTSNFNRCFKMLKNKTPFQFKTEFGKI